MKVCTDACLFGAWCATELAATSTQQKLLDIGAGTGLLSLMILQKHAITIDAVEIDEAAATQARQNVAASGWQKNITVLKGDILSMDFSKSYDYIVSNPPFYENDLRSPDNKRSTAHHSHHLPMQKLIHFIANNLKENGSFCFLLPYKRNEELHQLANNNHLIIHKEVSVLQSAAHAPFRVIIKGGFEKKTIEKSTLAIASGSREYTPEFTALLKDYYLYL